MTRDTRLYAVTPSLGVRLWLERDRVCLHAANEGGRGRAVGMAVLPLRQVGADPAHLACAVDVAAIGAAGQAARQAFQKTFLYPNRSERAGPIVEHYAPAAWEAVTQGGVWVLVLLLFWQRDPSAQYGTLLAGAGGEGAAAAMATAVAALSEWTDVSLAIEDALAGGSETWSRGLVHLDHADRPTARGGSPAGAGREAPAAAPLVFAVGSCQYPAGLLDATPATSDSRLRGRSGPADASMVRLGERLRRFADPDRPSLLVLAGDQVYVDETAGLFDPRAGAVPDPVAGGGIDGDWLRVPYQNWLGSVGALSVLGLVPSRMMLDDHEIDDNWTWLPPPVAPQDGRMNAALRRDGLAAYGRWQRDRPRSRQWHRYEQRGVQFFLADTRTERQGRKARLDPLADTAPPIMSQRQELALRAWLRHPRDRPAFVVSPSMLLPRRRTSARSERGALHSDAWDGYPRCLHALLVAIWHQGCSDLVFLSGDEHLSCVARITVTDRARTRSVRLHSIHSSGLYAPYPFANSLPEEFAAPDEWEFEDPCPRHAGAWYVCTVEVLRWVPGDGFAVLKLAPGAPGFWDLRVCFDRERDAPPPLTLSLPVTPPAV